MPRRKNRERITTEWERKTKNIGVIAPHPFSILEEYIQARGLDMIISLFFDGKTEKVSSLDLCAFLMYWWEDTAITAARSSVFKHPTHHSSEYIFDRGEERIVIQVRQPDLDGEHWKAEHIHLIRGKINPSASCQLVYPGFDEHVELIKPTIPGIYIMCVK